MFKPYTFLLLIALIISSCSAPNPTSSPPPTSTPTQIIITANETESVATPEPISGVEGDESECENPFYPVSDEATWTYTISSGGSVVHTMSADDFGKFTTTIVGDNSTFTVDGQCTPDGIVIMDTPGASTTYSGENSSSTVTTVDVSGVTLPKDVAQGQEWTQTINVTIGENKSTIESDYIAFGFENITVPAGDFYALKVEQSGYVTVFGQKVEMHGFHWYAEGVGVVKSAMDGAQSVELVSYDIPD